MQNEHLDCGSDGSITRTHCKPLTAVMSANSSGINLVDSKNVCLSYSILARDSLKAASMDHGLQYNAIYWETGHRTFLPFWASLKQKFSWKIIDDQIRHFFGIHQPVTTEPFVFYGRNSYFRSYYGDRDVSTIIPLKKTPNFAFVPTGTKDPFFAEQKSVRMAGTEAFNEIIRSAFLLDFEHDLNVKPQ
eukprot:GHVT01025117.1.p1 GENE.GHVT01025117.1~~GHVT01025117.1.p1  ORF type:complete len:189 (+),score=7.32 GHVT01025117.1:346-912(+)